MCVKNRHFTTTINAYARTRRHVTAEMYGHLLTRMVITFVC